MKIECKTHGCGYIFDIGDKEIAVINYPDDRINVISHFLLYPNQLLCPQCNKITDYDKDIFLFYLVFFNKYKEAILYITEKTQKKENHKELTDKIQSDHKNLGFNVEITYNSDDFRAKVRKRIADIVFPLVNTYIYLETDKEKQFKWKLSKIKDIDKNIFTALYLYSNGILSIKINAREGYENEFESKSSSDIEKSALAIIKEIYLEFRILKWQEIAINNHNQNTLDKLHIHLFENFDELDIDDSFFELAKKIIGNITNEKSQMINEKYVYSYLASYSIFCVVAERKNEFQKEFTEIFFKHLITYYKHNANYTLIKPIAKNVVQKVIDFHEFHLLTLEFLIHSYDNKEESLKLVDIICTEFDLEANLERVSQDVELKIDAQQLNSDQIDYLLEMLIKEKDALHRYAYIKMFSEYLSNLLNNNNLKNFNSTYSKIIEKLKSIKDIKNLVEITCRASELLNSKNLPEFAINKVKLCKKYLSKNKIINDEYNHYDLRTEEANSLRYLGKHQEALALYVKNREDFINKNVSFDSHDFRVNERNLAIVFNDLNQPNQGIDILLKLLAYSSDKEKVMLYNSIGISYFLAGRYPDAYKAFLKGYEIIENVHNSMQNEKIYLLLGLKNCSIKLGYDANATQAAFEALNIAHKINNQILVARIGASILINMHKLLIEKDMDLKNLRDYTIQIIEKILPLNNIIKMRQSEYIGLKEALAVLLYEQKEFDKCETIINQLLKEFELNFHDKWKLYWLLSLIKLENNYINEALQLTFDAYNSFYQEINLEVKAFDAIFITDNLSNLQFSSISTFYNKYTQNLISDIQFLNLINIQNSLILLSNLRKKNLTSEIAFISEKDLHNFYSSGNIKKLLILQSFDLASTTHFQVISINDENIEYKILNWSINRDELIQLGEKINSKINNWNPAKKENPLSTIREFSQLEADLLNEVKELCEEGTHICIVANSFMVDIPLHYFISKEYTCNYVPSLFILKELRNTRDEKLKLKKLTNYYVWRSDEYEKITASLKESAKYLKSKIENHSAKYEEFEGINATKEQLINCLQNSDIVKISCHGFIDKYRNKFSLIVSNGRQLPPTNYEAIYGTNSKEFLINWDNLNFDNCATHVFCSACSSGTIYTTNGNESIGLGRALLNNGCKSFVSPSWEVISEKVQKIIDDTILEYVNNNSNLADVLFEHQK